MDDGYIQLKVSLQDYGYRFHLSRLFLYKIQHQCEFAISDYNDIMFGLSQHSTRKVFHSLQSFLIAAANISS